MSNADKRARKQENKRAAQEQRYAQWAATRRRRRARKVAPVVGLIIAGTVGLALLLGGDEPSESADDTTTTTIERVEPKWDGALCAGKSPVKERQFYTATPDMQIAKDAKFRTTIETSEGTMVAELDAAEDAKTVNNFVFLACEGFFDDNNFHRVIDGFMIQGGSADGSGAGDAGYRYTGGKPDSAYEVGDIVMANAGDPSSNGSQFFIVTGPRGVALDLNYTRFGKLVEGVGVAKKIAALQDKTNQDPSRGDGPPQREITIVNVTVEPV